MAYYIHNNQNLYWNKLAKGKKKEDQKKVILNKIKICVNVPNKMNIVLETVHTIDKNNSQTEI